MPISDSEAAELLALLRARVQDSMYRDLDEQIILQASTFETDRLQLSSYLRMLVAMVSERSSIRADDIERRLASVLSVEGDHRFGGVEVQLSEPEQRQFGIESFTLHELDASGPFVSELRELLAAVEDDFEPPEPFRGGMTA